MPPIFKVGSYIVYFWSNENEPLEPVHVHIAKNTPQKNATKVWITKNGKTLVCNNSSRIPSKDLRDLIKMIEANSEEIIDKWYEYFGEIRFFC